MKKKLDNILFLRPTAAGSLSIGRVDAAGVVGVREGDSKS